MKFLQFSSFLAALAGVTTADHLRAWDMAVPGVEIQRVWYGDGNAYVGRIPPTTTTALNFTVDSSRRDLLFIKADHSDSPRPSLQKNTLPDPTFLVANVQDGDFHFAHSAVGLGHDSIFLFTGIEGFWYPRTRSSIAKGETYLVPTKWEGTYQVKWIVDGGEGRKMKGRPVTLATRGDAS